MTKVVIRGTLQQRERPSAGAREPSTAEDCVYALPTVEQVVMAGYEKSYWTKIKTEREQFIERFNSDPEFRAKAIADAKEAIRIANERDRETRKS